MSKKLGHSTAKVFRNGVGSIALRLEKRRADEMDLTPGDMVEVDIYEYKERKE